MKIKLHWKKHAAVAPPFIGLETKKHCYIAYIWSWRKVTFKKVGRDV